MIIRKSDEEIELLSKAKIKELIKRWSGEYSQDELLFLENFSDISLSCFQ